MPNPSLIRVRCLDAERAVGLVNYADMVVYDQEKNVVALRIGGYPETVQAMSDAILGGCELELTGFKSSLCLNSKGRRNYARRISHDGVYAEGIHWLQDDSLQSLAVGQDDDDPKSEKETVSLKRNLYIFCTSSAELFDELDRKLSVPLLPEFRGYFLSELKKRGLLNRLKVYCPGQKFQCWHMRVSENESEIAQILEDGLKDGSIAIPESSPGQEDVFRHIASFTAYLREFGDKIAGCDAGGSSGTGAGGRRDSLVEPADYRSFWHRCRCRRPVSGFGADRPQAVWRRKIMEYGYFDHAAREYVITRPDTPTPWINYLGGNGFGGIISNTGGGLCFDGDPSNRRVTRYKFNNQPIDRPGRYLYIRDEETGEYWSPTWQPVMREMQHYECRHGLGYTRITGVYADIETEILYYVPLGKRYELWQVTMRNLSDRPRRLRVFSYVEFSWNDARYDMLCHWPCMALMADFDTDRIVVDTVAEQLTGVPMYDYIAADLPVDGYDCSLKSFIGSYRDESCPQVLEAGQCSNSAMHSDNCVGVLSSPVPLSPGESRRFHYTLGAAERREEIAGQIADAFSSATQRTGLQTLREYWSAYCSRQQVETPCGDMNTMLNLWHAYQAKTTFDWSRFISLYERGVDRGFGFRDSMQDVLGILHADAPAAAQRIKLLLSIQKNDGSAHSVYYPATGEAVGGGRSDDHLWSVFSVCSYIRETGDVGFLEERIAYADGGDGTVLEHLERGMAFTMAHLGRHGIPDMLASDWNDSLAPMNRGGTGGAESVFVFFQLAHAAYELLELYRHTNREERSGPIRKAYEYCRGKLPTVWDGQWFLRAFTPEGEKYGTHEDEWNRLYLNPQSWSVLSRLPDAGQANLAMDQVMKYLYTPQGLLTHTPASSGFDRQEKGYYLFTAGARENGGIFFHSNTWAIIALALLGRAEEAFRCYAGSLPVRRNRQAERWMTEPYVYAQTMLAPPHERAGACVNSWLTGTASWMYVAATQYILGVRPDYEGLRIDPQVPDDWAGFRVERMCRQTHCRIEMRRSSGEDKGLFVQGQKCPDDLVPWSWLDGREQLDILLVR